MNPELQAAAAVLAVEVLERIVDPPAKRPKVSLALKWYCPLCGSHSVRSVDGKAYHMAQCHRRAFGVRTDSSTATTKEAYEKAYYFYGYLDVLLTATEGRVLMLGDAVASMSMEVTLANVGEVLLTLQKLGIITLVMRRFEPWISEAAFPLTEEDLKPLPQPRSTRESLEKVKNVSVVFDTSRKAGRANATLHFWTRVKCPAHSTVMCNECYELRGVDAQDKSTLQTYVKFPL